MRVLAELPIPPSEQLRRVAIIMLSEHVPLQTRGIWQGEDYEDWFLSRSDGPLGGAYIVYAIGQALGALLGGLFSDTVGWRWYCLSSTCHRL